MQIHAGKPLFAWDELEDSPTLKTTRKRLDILPDQPLLDSLLAARGKGRDDVPVRVAWGVCCYDVVSNSPVRHPMWYIGYEPSRETIKCRGPAVPGATRKFERLYQGRTAEERVNVRLKIFWDADDGNLTGSRRFFALRGAIPVMHAAFATLLAMAPRWEGTLGQTKLDPIARALRGGVFSPVPPRSRPTPSGATQNRLRFAG